MTTQQLFYALLLGVSCALIGATVINVLSKEPILNWWFVLGERLGKTVKDRREVERWFYKPIWGCDKCFSGQLALWSFAVTRTDWGAFKMQDYSIFCHVLAVCTAVFMSVIFSLTYSQLKKHE